MLAAPLSTIAVRPLLSHCLVHHMALAWFLPESFQNSLFETCGGAPSIHDFDVCFFLKLDILQFKK
jgi:hypothetical protein